MADGSPQEERIKFVESLIPFYAKDVVMHMIALTTFAVDVFDKNPEAARAIFEKMDRPKPKQFETLIDGATFLLAELTLSEEEISHGRSSGDGGVL